MLTNAGTLPPVIILKLQLAQCNACKIRNGLHSDSNSSFTCNTKSCDSFCQFTMGMIDSRSSPSLLRSKKRSFHPADFLNWYVVFFAVSFNEMIPPVSTRMLEIVFLLSLLCFSLVVHTPVAILVSSYDWDASIIPLLNASLLYISLPSARSPSLQSSNVFLLMV